LSIRIERLKELIREVAAKVILHELQDPRIGFCTVTRVDLAKDLSTAVVFVSILGDDNQKRTTYRGLKEATGVIQSRIAGAMHTRTTPRVTIAEDESIERSFRILEKIREARASDPDGGKGPLSEDEIPQEE
jgi:ribosome-binding factor A